MSALRFAWHFMAALDGEYGERIQGHILGRLLGLMLAEAPR